MYRIELFDQCSYEKKSQKKRKQLIEEREEIFDRLMTENFPEKRVRCKTFYQRA